MEAEARTGASRAPTKRAEHQPTAETRMLAAGQPPPRPPGRPLERTAVTSRGALDARVAHGGTKEARSRSLVQGGRRATDNETYVGIERKRSRSPRIKNTSDETRSRSQQTLLTSQTELATENNEYLIPGESEIVKKAPTHLSAESSAPCPGSALSWPPSGHVDDRKDMKNKSSSRRCARSRPGWLRWLALAALLTAAHAQKPSLAGSKRRDVYIAGFFPFGRQVAESGVGRGVMPSVMLAVDHVNESPDVLRNYMLHMYWNDTECNTAVGVKAFFDMMHMRPAKVMLFGAACTHVTDPIAKASKRWHLTQLSYADTHPMFTPRHFPNFFRVVPSENAFNLPRLKLLETFNWTRVGTIYQNEPRYSLAHNHLVADLDAMGFQVAETQSFGNEVATAMLKLKQKDVRIILGNFNESWARRIFCEAHRAGMFGRKYQWLIMGTYADQWWTAEEGVVACAPTELQTALEGCILTDLLPLSTSGEITVSGFTADEYLAEYDSRRGGEYSRFHGYTYDGIWAVALAIQHVARRVRVHRKNATVADFRYRDPLWEMLFLEALRNTSFEGVTGPVRFYDNERKASILLKQFQNGSELKIGEFNGVTGQLDLTRGGPIRWQGRHPPKDRTLQIFEHSHVNVTLYAGIAATASVGIVVAAAFLAVNIRYRNQRYIKMSSPYLNNLIIVGCMLTYSSVLFLGLDSTLTSIDSFPYICTARAWLLMAGFSLAFGSMFSKTWRVHSIFTDVTLNKKVIKDYQLFMVVGILLFVDLAIMTTWQVADPFYRETKQMEPYPHPSSEDILIIPENEYCASEQMTVFVGSIYAYKGLLMIFGAFLAWETRNVNIPALNDSKYVGMSVYNVVIMCVMGAAVSFVLSDKQDASFVLISVFIIFCTTGTLCLVFVPKLVELRRNPHGSIDKRCRATLRPVSKTRRDSAAHEAEVRLRDAKSGNAALRAQLAAKEAELAALLRRVGDDAADAAGGGGGGVATQDRLAVPQLLRKEAPSATETTDVSSLCSLTSSQDGGDYVNLTVETPQRTKKAVFAGKQSALAVTAARDIASMVGGASMMGVAEAGGVADTEDRPRMSTPTQQPLAKVVSFGDVTDSSAPILLPPRQFVPRVPSASTSVSAVAAAAAGCVRHAATPPTTPSRQQHDARAQASYREDVARNGYSREDVGRMGYSREDVGRTGYSREDVGRTGYSREDVGRTGYSREDLGRTGYSREDLGRTGYSREDVGRTGYSREDVGRMGYGREDGHLGGYRDDGLYREDVYRECGVDDGVGVGAASCRKDGKRRSSFKASPPSGVQRRTSVPCCHVANQASSARGARLVGEPALRGLDRRDLADLAARQRDRLAALDGGDLLLSAALVRHSPRDLDRECASMQRSVSAKCGARMTPGVGGGGGGGRGAAAAAAAAQRRRRHVQSTPDVAHPPSAASVSSLCAAASEGELLDLAILPIFQKLLSERLKRRPGYGASVASCPNISIKCDIVEYL